MVNWYRLSWNNVTVIKASWSRFKASFRLILAYITTHSDERYISNLVCPRQWSEQQGWVVGNEKRKVTYHAKKGVRQHLSNNRLEEGFSWKILPMIRNETHMLRSDTIQCYVQLEWHNSRFAGITLASMLFIFH